jgi:hypothetical protein
VLAYASAVHLEEQRPYQDSRNRSQHVTQEAPRGVSWNVNDIPRLKREIRRTAVQDGIEIDGQFLLFAIGTVPNDDNAP